jgi:hypothetical protein
MRHPKLIITALLAVSVLIGSLSADSTTAKDKKLKPYTLKNCIVSGDKLGGDMGDPYVFAEGDREIKLCCKSCFKDFKKDKVAFLKKIDDAEKKAAADKKN